MTEIWSWIPVVPELLGREKERGYKILANILELRSELSAKILAN